MTESSQERFRPAWAVVDLDALARNLDHVRGTVGEAGVLAVVKADAYGHGAPTVGRALEQMGIDWLGVALVEEGIELRRGGVEAPILVLGTAQPEQLPLFCRFRLTPALSSLDQLAMWCAWLSGTEAPETTQTVHLKVDTGMSRLGVSMEEVGTALERIRADPRLHLGGVASHLAEAEDLQSSHTPEQEERFLEVLTALTPAERQGTLVHLANSAAALHRVSSRHTLVRVGLALYGLDPAGEDEELEPVMSVRARIVQVRRIDAGTAVGYGGEWVAERASRIAVVPVGYADGYAWRLSGRASALVGGTRVPVVGAVSMDMITLDVTDTEAGVGDEVVLMGQEGGKAISAHELAELAGSIPYEILCGFGLRLPRLYLQGGREAAFGSRLLAGDG